MLTREDNELVTRVGPGTPMGKLMRRYWMPALLSSELERDGAPVRVRLLGERLIAFRDTEGRIGLIEEFCAHRRVSMYLARNEECGIRCVYHGWKYDVNGRCIDMPTEPAGSTFKDKIRMTAYKTVELGGVVFAWMSEGEAPAPPRFEWTRLRPDQRVVTRTWQECNWLQALEGGIDAAHAAALHTVLDDTSKRAGLGGLWRVPVPQKDEVEMTSWGHAYASSRPMPDGTKWVRVYHYVMPFYTLFPFEFGGNVDVLQPIINGHIFVPMDDENTMVFNWIGKYGDEPMGDEQRSILEWSRGRAPGEVSEGPAFRKKRNQDVDWLIDRSVQKSETYSGIDGINNQDHAVQESMGPIVDRSRENLGTTDAAVIATRRLLLRVLKTNDADPPGVQPTYYNVRAIERMLPAGAPWQAALKTLYDVPEGMANKMPEKAAV